MTLSDITRALTEAGIENARSEALWLIEHFCGVSVAAVRMEPSRDYAGEALREAVEKRCTRYPLQYILGKWEFCGLEFKVNEHTLIPRPDTEVIVEAAVKHTPRGGRILDLCTGTGCILASVLSLSAAEYGIGVELYHETARVAEENIEKLGLGGRAGIVIGDATADLFPEGEKFDVIVSNPPYVTLREMAELEPELSHEPEAALTDGGDGLSIIKKIVSVYKSHLTDGGVMIIEHGHLQGEAMAEIARENGMEYEPIFDYGGKCRGARLTHIIN